MAHLYNLICDHLNRLIQQNSLKPHDKLPSERLLVQRFNSTRITIREALFRLEAEGTIYRLKRKGWFVAPPRFVINPTSKCDFTQMALDQGHHPTTEVLSILKSRPLANVRNQLQLQNNQSVYQLKRLRRLDCRAVMMENIFLAANRFIDIHKQNLNGSLSAIQRQQYAIQLGKEDCRMRILALDQAHAAALEVNPGSPCLQIERLRFDHNMQAFDYNLEFWLHNAVEMQVSVR
ncbi:MAG: UTRA domain-containing protein [Gammaproteobacteria bacterium]|nr:UTRA domain-containing protein [Gammaproteobacteria bacterium]